MWREIVAVEKLPDNEHRQLRLICGHAHTFPDAATWPHYPGDDYWCKACIKRRLAALRGK
jgi:hypothetical protein